MMVVQIDLTVNDNPIRFNNFVAKFVDQTFSGMIASLANTGPVHDLHYAVDDSRISVRLNGSDVAVNEFVTKIFISTTNGILVPLKGVTPPVRKVRLSIRK